MSFENAWVSHQWLVLHFKTIKMFQLIIIRNGYENFFFHTENFCLLYETELNSVFTNAFRLDGRTMCAQKGLLRMNSHSKAFPLAANFELMTSVCWIQDATVTHGRLSKNSIVDQTYWQTRWSQVNNFSTCPPFNVKLAFVCHHWLNHWHRNEISSSSENLFLYRTTLGHYFYFFSNIQTQFALVCLCCDVWIRHTHTFPLFHTNNQILLHKIESKDKLNQKNSTIN